jgi:hypothetical protein
MKSQMDRVLPLYGRASGNTIQNERIFRLTPNNWAALRDAGTRH